MTWLTLEDKDYRHAAAELMKQRDRGAGIIAAAILQDHLLALIKTRIDIGSEIEANMFKQSGPLGSFGAQIDLGFLFGLYPEQVRQQMHLIRLIRNDFAHNVQPVSFRSQRARCAKLNVKRGAGREFNKTWADMTEEKTGKRTTLSSFRSSNNPRTQYLNATKQITMYLTFMTALSRFDTSWTKPPRGAPRPSSLEKS